MSARTAARDERDRSRTHARERGKRFWTVENLTSPPTLLVASTVLLLGFGLLMILSASSIELVEDGLAAWKEFVSQGAFIAVSIVACVVAYKLHAASWVNGWQFNVLFALVIVMLLATLVMGEDSHGATRWLKIGPVSVQPSEFAKILLVMGAARLLAKWQRGEFTTPQLAARFVGFICVPAALVFLQKDLGTILIAGSSIYLMAVLAKVRARTLALVAAVAALLVVAMIATAGYRSARFATWLDPYADYYGDGWQPIHGMYAFASGGLFGLGIGNSRQKYSYLPEAENDYIFAIVGEELGFVGTMAVVSLFVLWAWSGMRIAYRAREHDRVLSLMASGLSVMIAVQALLNMGGALGVIPLSGRPLPFISAGGSSVLANMIIVALLLGVWDETSRGPARSRDAARTVRPHLTVIDGGQADRPVAARASRPAPPPAAPRPPRGGEGGVGDSALHPRRSDRRPLPAEHDGGREAARPRRGPDDGLPRRGNDGSRRRYADDCRRRDDGSCRGTDDDLHRGGAARGLPGRRAGRDNIDERGRR